MYKILIVNILKDLDDKKMRVRKAKIFIMKAKERINGLMCKQEQSPIATRVHLLFSHKLWLKKNALVSCQAIPNTAVYQPSKYSMIIK